MVSKLLSRGGYEALWVNTIGTRTPRLTMEDLGKAAVKLRQWVTPPTKISGNTTRNDHTPTDSESPSLPAGLTVVTPKMLPTFRGRIARAINARSIANAVNRALGPRTPGQRRVVVTTIPVVADVVGKLDADRWLYYCVDDFSVWPGLDGGVMRNMEEQLAPKVDGAIAVSDTLRDHLSALGCQAGLLTHGIDLWHWGPAQSGRLAGPDAGGGGSAATPLPGWWSGLQRPIVLFWGLIDRRLDTQWCSRLSGALRDRAGGSIVLVGPSQSPDPAIEALPGVTMPGAAQYDRLPRMAAEADVLIMPYADLPVTRAMQPLKFKEYLATGRPVVVRSLPATRDWADCADVADDPEAFVQSVLQRIDGDVPPDQQAARERRLPAETWQTKAEQFESTILGLFEQPPTPEPVGA